MNTHNIEPMKYGGDKNDDYVTGWNDCWAAIEADRKLHDRMLAHEWIRPALNLPENAPYRFDYYAQEIERLRNDRKRRGEPVAWRWKWKDLPNAGWQLSSVGGWRETDAIKAEPLYLAPVAPQPALDAADLAFIADELRQAGKNRAADLVLTAMAYPTQPAEPVKLPSDSIDIEDVRRYLDSWGCLAHPGVRALLARYTTTKEQP